MADLLIETTDGVGIATFNRPHEMNALSPDIVEGMIDATQAFERDPKVRAVLIRGAGDNFMAGGNVKGFHKSVTEDREAYLAGMERRVVTGHLMIHRLRRMAKPVVVAVQGAVVGYGVSTLCAADLAIGSDDTFFMLAYRHVGLTTDGGVSYFLPRIVGERRALEITLMGERFGADKALDWGLLNWVVPKAELQDRALDLATRLAAGPTAALAGAKRLIRGSLQSSWDEQSAREAEAIAEMIGTEDHREGVSAFVEKRKPVYVGR